MRRFKPAPARLLFMLLVSLCGAAPAILAGQSPSPEQMVRDAKASAGSVLEQGLALGRLAWPESGTVVNARAAALARENLIGFGREAMSPLRRIIRRVGDTPYSADATAALIRARLFIDSGVEPDFLVGLEDVLWFGSADAKRIAIPELALHGRNSTMLAMIDAAYDHPELTAIVLESLVTLKDDRARFFLADLLREGPDRFRPMAADALARIGGRAMDTLRDAALSDRGEVRSPAIVGLLPLTGLDDLTALYEYVTLHGDDDPQLLEQVRQRAIMLEKLLEQQRTQSSASEANE